MNNEIQTTVSKHGITFDRTTYISDKLDNYVGQDVNIEVIDVSCIDVYEVCGKFICRAYDVLAKPHLDKLKKAKMRLLETELELQSYLNKVDI